MYLTLHENNAFMELANHENNALNGGLPRTEEESTTYLFMDELAEEINLTINQTKGVLGSMVKKGLIYVDDIDNDETLVTLSKEAIRDILWS